MSAPIAAEILADPIANYPVATVAAFDPTSGTLPRRKLDAHATRAYLERLAEAGAPAVLIAASTGHGHLRTTDELAEWFTVAAAAHTGSMVRMALLRPEDGLPANEHLLDLLQSQDYAVVFVRPGTDLWHHATAADVAANMQPIVAAAAARGLPVGVYSIPDVSGLPLTPEATAMLAAGLGGQNIVAVKVTEADYDTSTLLFLQHPALKHLKIVQGWDPHLARALQDGPKYDSANRQRCGVTSGPMSFAVYQYLHIFEAAAAGNWDEVSAAQSAVTSLFQSLQDDPTKFADLQRAKCIMGLGEPLTGRVSSDQTARVFAALDALPRAEDRRRLARSLNLMGNGPFHSVLAERSK